MNDKLLTYAAKLIANPNDEKLREDPFFVEKKEVILKLLAVLSKPNVKKKGNVLSGFPSKEQMRLREYYERITGADRNIKQKGSTNSST